MQMRERAADPLHYSFTTELKGTTLRCVIDSPDLDLSYLVYLYVRSGGEQTVFYRDPAFTRDTVREYDLSEKMAPYPGPVEVRVKVYARKGAKKQSALGTFLPYDAAPEGKAAPERPAPSVGEGSPYSFTTELKGTTLRCVIDSPDPEQEYLVHLYVIEDQGQTLLHRDARFTKETTREYDLSEKLIGYPHSIALRPKVYVRKGDRKRSRFGAPVYYVILPEKSHIPRPKERPEGLPDQLPFCRREAPFADFCLVYGYPKANIQKMVTGGGWHTHRFSRISDSADVPCWMISSQPTVETQTCTLYFSGLGRSDTMLLLGQEDAKNLPDPRTLRDTVGRFTMVYRDAEKICVLNDYFGAGKLFYYAGRDGFLVSDRYHLLLLVMKALGLPLRIHHEKWLADLWRIDPPSVQISSRDMEVEDTYILPIDRRIEIDRDGLHLLASEIDSVLRDPGAFRPEAYMDLLAQAGEEIADNIRAVYRNPKVRKVSIDVTGGLDTRVVLSAWTRLREADKHGIPTRMFTVLKETFPEDAYIGTEIARRAGLPFSAYPSEVTALDVDGYALREASWYFLTRTGYPKAYRRRHTQGMIHLYGAFGDGIARSHWSRPWYYSRGDFASIKEMLNAFSGQRGYPSVVWEPILQNAWEHEMEREFQALSGRSPCEKLDLFYLYYRDRTISESLGGDPRWGPLQSKTLFRLKMLTYYSFPEIKLEVNLFESLSPMIADVRLGNPVDIKAREALLKAGELLSDGYGRLPEMDRKTIDTLRATFAREEAAMTKDLIAEEERDAIREKQRTFPETELVWLRYALFPVLDVVEKELGGAGRRNVEQWVYEQILSGKSPRKKYFIDQILHMYYLTRLIDA